MPGFKPGIFLNRQVFIESNPVFETTLSIWRASAKRIPGFFENR